MSASNLPDAVRLEETGEVPNNPLCPALHYHAVLGGEAKAMARAFEDTFRNNGWPPAWRNGVFSYHHFHSRAHEVLGIYRGHAEIMLGGEGGPVVAVAAGDVVVVPAGVGHCKLSCDGRLAIVGAYPASQSPDLCTPDADTCAARARAVSEVPMPRADPVAGQDGPMMTLWSQARG